MTSVGTSSGAQIGKEGIRVTPPDVRQASELYFARIHRAALVLTAWQAFARSPDEAVPLGLLARAVAAGAIAANMRLQLNPLVATAVSILLRSRLIALTQNADAPPPVRQAVLTVITGAAIGVLVSISSVGAGAIGVTVLLLLYPRLPTARIVGTDIAHAVPLTLCAGIGHWWLGAVDPVILASLFAYGFDYTLMGFAPTIGWLFLGRAVAGIAGAGFVPANAYIAFRSPTVNAELAPSPARAGRSPS